MDRYDYIIVGSGIAGLYAALLAREHGSVLVLTKGSVDDCNTRWAQGGIAAPVGPGDSPRKHLDDTIAAGAGLVDPEAAGILTQEAPDRIDDLVRFGVPFDTLHGEIALAREGAHSLPRVLHAGGDSTGAHIELTLSSLAQQTGITVLEHTLATEILLDEARPSASVHPELAEGRPSSARPEPVEGRVRGIRARDERSGHTTNYACRHLILATGGAGQLYSVTTNPEVATGNGIALAYRAGAEVMDMEFFQFHPTALRLPGVQPFLISEAVRGEGGILVDTDGVRFMPEYDDRAELAPRDVVARAILDRMQRTDADHVLLDITSAFGGDPARIIARFPQIYRFCLDQGLDITRQPIPVSPAAHYTMGGIRTNVWGETNIPGLYACGECACTGVHGANRLASNSLLETVVFARRVVNRTLEKPDAAAEPASDAIDLPQPAPAEACPEPSRRACPEQSRRGPPLSREALQSLMWDQVGIVRDGETLSRARTALSAWHASLPPSTDRPSHELADLLLCARLATEAALIREESRGAHYRSDFPQSRDDWRRHIVFRKGA